MNVYKPDLPIQVEPHEPQRPVVPNSSTREDEQLFGTIPVGRPQGGDQPERDPEDADRWDDSLAPQTVLKGVVNPEPLIAVTPPVEAADIPAIRDLLFSIRDQGTYCAWCRCPEWSQNEMRSSHYEGCILGLMCEKLLRLHPREGYHIKWRK